MNGTQKKGAAAVDQGEKLIRQSSNGSVGHTTGDRKPEGRVLVIYTGGTIGMIRNEQGGKNFSL